MGCTFIWIGCNFISNIFSRNAIFGAMSSALVEISLQSFSELARRVAIYFAIFPADYNIFAIFFTFVFNFISKVSGDCNSHCNIIKNCRSNFKKLSKWFRFRGENALAETPTKLKLYCICSVHRYSRQQKAKLRQESPSFERKVL
jgi:hypothetical protein